MLIFRQFLLALSLLGAPLAHVQAQATAATAPHYPSSEELRHLKAVSAPLLSPDGQKVLFTVTDATADGAKSHLWLVPVAGAEKARPLTVSPASDKHGERKAQWAPDGGAVYFLAHRGEHAQIYRLDMRGGEAQTLELKVRPAVDNSKEKDAIPPAKEEAKQSSETKQIEPLDVDVTGYEISPDGKRLAFLARDPETPGEKLQKEAKADATWVNHDRHQTRLYLVPLNGSGLPEGEPRVVLLTPEAKSVVWSPDSNRLLVTAEEPNEAGDLGWAVSAWLVTTAAPEKPERLAALPAALDRGAAWSVDGKTLYFTAQTPEDAPPGYEELFAYQLGEAAPRRLTAGFAGQIESETLAETTAGIVTTAGIGTSTAGVRVPLEGTGAVAALDLGSVAVSALATNRKQTGWVWLTKDAAEPERLCYAAKLGAPCQPMALPELAPAGLKSIKPELVKWQSGPFTVEGLLYLPEAPAGKKVPLVVDVHGGPFGAWTQDRDDFANFLVGHGWAVLRPNPRGSSNYGVKFAAANKNDLGGGDYQDIMAGVDAVLARYPLDPTRMALIGYSYGGEMAGFVEGKTDRFKAIVSGAPVIDQFSEYGTEDQSWYDRWYFGKPWEHMADAWRQSPLAGVARAKTPFLLLQGEDDSTDPVGQSQEMYRALRQAGGPVELVTYPRENHGPLAGGMFGRPSPEPWHGFDARQRLVKFLEPALKSGN
jgi:dipeptidyl aminopeptidase/acylaminoacyl peptidase